MYPASWILILSVIPCFFIFVVMSVWDRSKRKYLPSQWKIRSCTGASLYKIISVEISFTCTLFPFWKEELLVMLRLVINFESSTQVEEFCWYFFRYILKDSWMERKPYHCLPWVCLLYLHAHVPASTAPAKTHNMLILSSPFCKMSILRSSWCIKSIETPLRPIY